ncbi:hypothetical protein BB560_001956 [Smittium megazygosporum]|uniref:Lysine--tRNA ligase n=1 Tax=Smittium megazygosporum TaxID=133381 RepID=A0A2T9ZG49_9FUNG|nr:hypothetical protein BB560_001956 [Smittium megazygosporum]
MIPASLPIARAFPNRIFPRICRLAFNYRMKSTISTDDKRKIKQIRLNEIQTNNLVPFPRYRKPKSIDQKLGPFSQLEIPELIEKFQHLEPGEKLENQLFYIEGRIKAKRSSSKKLYFYTLYKNGNVFQIVANLRELQAKSATANNPQENTFTELESSDTKINSNDSDIMGEFKKVNRFLQVGDIIRVTGYIGKTNTGELSIFATNQLELLSTCFATIPYSSGLEVHETRYRNRHVDFLTNPEARRSIVARAQVLSVIRNFFDSRGFLEVETPILWPSLGGANAKPFTTKAVALGDAKMFLRIAPELFLKRLVIGGFDRVYEIGKVFRNEGIDRNHNPEFTSCEFYQAYTNVEEMMDNTELLIREIVAKLNNDSLILEINQNKTSSSLDPDSSTKDTPLVIDFSLPFKRINVVEFLSEKLDCSFDFLAFDEFNSLGTDLDLYREKERIYNEQAVENLLKIFEKHNISHSNIPKTPTKLFDNLISIYIEPLTSMPTFLTDHPFVMSPLAKSKNSLSAARFELFINKQEIVNAYEELNNPDEQRFRFYGQLSDIKKGDPEAVLPDLDYCNALEFALPPTAGWGMGIDRLVSLLTNLPHLKESISFPIVK